MQRNSNQDMENFGRIAARMQMQTADLEALIREIRGSLDTMRLTAGYDVAMEAVRLINLIDARLIETERNELLQRTRPEEGGMAPRVDRAQRGSAGSGR